MENKEIKVTVENGVKELVVRHGKAEPVAEFRKGVKVSGTLSLPRIHLTNPPKSLTSKGLLVIGDKDNIDNVLAYSYLEVNRDKGSIDFIEDAGNAWENTYSGILEKDERFEKFNINTGKSYTTLELAEFIKMNRSHFETREKAMLLVSSLRNFKAKVDKDIENADDGRGNRKILLAQAVDSNIPESFKINVPIFKGYDKQIIEVEISIDAGDLSCTLISPEANDYIEEVKDSLIDAEIAQIRELHPTLRIFEV